MLSTMTWVSLGVVSLLISLCIMVAPFPAGDVLPGDGASADAVDAVSLGAGFVLVDELEVALGLLMSAPSSLAVFASAVILSARLCVHGLPNGLHHRVAHMF